MYTTVRQGPNGPALMSERTPGVGGESPSAREHTEAHVPDAIEAAPPPIQSVLVSVWEFAATSQDITDEQRGALGQVISAYVASEPNLPYERPPSGDMVDVVEAMQILGYRSENSIRYAVKTGKLAPHHERITPSGNTVRYFLREDVFRLRDDRLG